MDTAERSQAHQDDLRDELERNVLEAVRILVDSMGCESFSLPMPSATGDKKFLAFGTVAAISGLLRPAKEGDARAPDAQGKLDL